MSAVLVSLADGLAAEINAHSFNTAFEFEAVRSWGAFDLDLADTKEPELHVDIVPAGLPKTDLADRGGTVDWNASADIILRYKFPRTSTEESTGEIERGQVDALVNLTEQIIDMLYSDDHRRLQNYDAANILASGVEVRTIASRKDLREKRQFLAILRVTYENAE